MIILLLLKRKIKGLGQGDHQGNQEACRCRVGGNFREKNNKQNNGKNDCQCFGKWPEETTAIYSSALANETKRHNFWQGRNIFYLITTKPLNSWSSGS